MWCCADGTQRLWGMWLQADLKQPHPIQEVITSANHLRAIHKMLHSIAGYIKQKAARVQKRCLQRDSGMTAEWRLLRLVLSLVCERAWNAKTRHCMPETPLPPGSFHCPHKPNQTALFRQSSHFYWCMEKQIIPGSEPALKLQWQLSQPDVTRLHGCDNGNLSNTCTFGNAQVS